MRIIKFRAWNNSAKDWQTEYSGLTCSGDKLVMLPNQRYAVSEKVDLSFQLFTGILDKNGKEVYEGDIIASGTKSISYLIVKYDVDKARFMIHGHLKTGAFGKNFRYGLLRKRERLEVIGNIYENKELLEPLK